MQPRLTTAVALACLLLSACNRTRVRDCNALSQRINDGVARIEAHEAERREHPGGSPAQTARDMQKVAELYEQQASEVTATDLSDKELKNLAAEYAASLKSAAGSAHALAKALEANRPEEALLTDKLYAEHLERQKKAVAAINAYCAR